MPSLPPSWKPRLRQGLDYVGLHLAPEEGFVLSRIDGATSADQLPFLTGLPTPRIEQILDRLVALEVVEAPPDVEAPAEDGDDEGDDGAVERSPARDAEEGNWRRLFERELHPLPVDRRIELAATAQGNRLRALCFDPAPKVAAALFENAELGLEHARLLARHHRSSQGLTALSQEPAFVRDGQVQSELFRNPQTPEGLLQRILGSKRLDRLYALSGGRDATERVRRAAHQAFRRGFSKASAEERVQLILKTEGRCLAALSGVPLDGKAAALLCRRSLGSTLLVRNLARWPSTPPAVLQHLARQAIVQRSADLRNQILRHPNAPSGLGI